MSQNNDEKEEKTTKNPENRAENQPQGPTWTPETVTEIAKILKDLATEVMEKYAQVKKQDADAELRRLEIVGAHNRHLVYWLIAFLALTTILMGTLTFLNRVSGDALLFLAGTITGYIIGMIQHFVMSPVEGDEEETPE